MNKQSMAGQAVAEALISFMVLASVWFAVSWLARIQDLALEASLTARYAAFYATRQNDQSNNYVVPNKRFITQQQYQWQDQRGGALTPVFYDLPTITYNREITPSASAQLGLGNQNATKLREQWRAADTGLLNTQVTLKPKSVMQRYGFYPEITKNVSIATGSAHSGSDAHTAKNIAESKYGWSDQANGSYRMGRNVSSVASKLDSAWGRALPVFDWLNPWASDVPNFAIKNN